MVNVFYAGNRKVFDMIMISALSMSKTASEPLSIYVVTMDLSDENPKYVPISNAQAGFLDKLIKKYNPENRVILMDVTETFKKERFDSPNNLEHFTPYTLLRLYAHKYDFPDKIIYLDVDTVINNDIAELYNQDIEDYELGVVRDVFIFGLRLKKTYFNAGMLLINVKKCRETGLFDKALERFRTVKMMMLDQDALNYTVTHKKMLDRKFNSIHVPKKRYQDVVVHHMCDCRAYLIKRYKSRDFDMVKKHMPYYAPLIDEVIELKKESDLLD